MTPIDVLFELFGRVGACQGGAILVNEEELHQWPDTAVKAMKSQKLIVKARPASSTICPGCERECVMRVHTLPAKKGSSSSFILCDKRSDINRVSVASEKLTQWQCNADLVGKFVSSSLCLRAPARQSGNASRWEIGIASGDKRNQMLCLETDNTLALMAGKSTIPLADLIEFHDHEYAVNNAMVRRLVDAATTVDERYTPSNARREARKLDTQAMYESWQKVCRDLKKKHPNMSDVWISRKIAKMPIANGRDPETIRKNMKK